MARLLRESDEDLYTKGRVARPRFGLYGVPKPCRSGSYRTFRSFVVLVLGTLGALLTLSVHVYFGPTGICENVGNGRQEGFAERLWVADTNRVTAGHVVPRCAWNYF